MGSTRKRIAYDILLLVQRLGGIMCFVIAAYLFATRETWQAVQMLTLAFAVSIAADVTDIKRKG